ncbi:conserved protein of unknown function [Nitrosotalea devaniterrae]|uniref:Uncharacterized protein n=1 Tax=Nitrosotalea devaniterrae TaxID=1078905 RepID=A0A128A2F2_9ARCH|nr:conserved protein of unknown function [Candidatus Nitrosotalea devanaterra]
MSEDKIQSSRFDVLDLMDSFIKKILEIRRTLLGVSISGFILAPFAIGLSIFLITHQHFFIVLEREYDFGIALSILLGVVIAISVGWMITGFKQYKTLKSWNKKYQEYQQQKDDIDKKIASQYGLDQD